MAIHHEVKSGYTTFTIKENPEVERPPGLTPHHKDIIRRVMEGELAYDEYQRIKRKVDGLAIYTREGEHMRVIALYDNMCWLARSMYIDHKGELRVSFISIPFLLSTSARSFEEACSRPECPGKLQLIWKGKTE